jgi:hypothetical protein
MQCNLESERAPVTRIANGQLMYYEPQGRLTSPVGFDFDSGFGDVNIPDWEIVGCPNSQISEALCRRNKMHIRSLDVLQPWPVAKQA